MTLVDELLQFAVARLSIAERDQVLAELRDGVVSSELVVCVRLALDGEPVALLPVDGILL